MTEKIAATAPAHKAIKEPKEDSRPAMMQRAKEAGLKYYRILSKDELIKVLATKDRKMQEAIIQAAKKRWMSCPFFQKKNTKGGNANVNG